MKLPIKVLISVSLIAQNITILALRFTACEPGRSAVLHGFRARRIAVFGGWAITCMGGSGDI